MTTPDPTTTTREPALPVVLDLLKRHMKMLAGTSALRHLADDHLGSWQDCPDENCTGVRELIVEGHPYYADQPTTSSPVPRRAPVGVVPLTDAELAEIEARAAAATPGPWIAYDQNEGGSHAPLWAAANDPFFNPHDDTEHDAFGADVTCGGKDDAAFIAAARTDVPRLVAALRSAREELMSARAERVELIRERDDLRGSDAELRGLIGALHAIERDLREENTLLRSWLDDVGTVVSGAVGDRHVDQPPAVGVRQIAYELDQYRQESKRLGAFANAKVQQIKAAAASRARIAEAHSKHVDEHGGTWGECNECGHSWPCPTYAWATTERDPNGPWDPADDEAVEEGADRAA